MSYPIPNQFTSYHHTEEEVLQSHLFTALNLEMLNNELSSLSSQKLAITIDPANPTKYIQEEAYIRGKIDNLMWLIEVSRLSTQEIASTYEQQSQTDFTTKSVQQTIFGSTP